MQAGSARSHGNELKHKGHHAIAAKWLAHADQEKQAAVQSTVAARKLAIRDGQQAAERAKERALARARARELATKQKQTEARNFHHQAPCTSAPKHGP